MNCHKRINLKTVLK